MQEIVFIPNNYKLLNQVLVALFLKKVGEINSVMHYNTALVLSLRIVNIHTLDPLRKDPAILHYKNDQMCTMPGYGIVWFTNNIIGILP